MSAPHRRLRAGQRVERDSCRSSSADGDPTNMLFWRRLERQGRWRRSRCPVLYRVSAGRDGVQKPGLGPSRRRTDCAAPFSASLACFDQPACQPLRFSFGPSKGDPQHPLSEQGLSSLLAKSCSSHGLLSPAGSPRAPRRSATAAAAPARRKHLNGREQLAAVDSTSSPAVADKKTAAAAAAATAATAGRLERRFCTLERSDLVRGMHCLPVSSFLCPSSCQLGSVVHLTEASSSYRLSPVCARR